MTEKVKIKVRDVDGGIDGAPPWITTFVDMVSLLVTFFILLFTFSSIRNYDEFTFPRNVVATSGIWKERTRTDMLAPNDDVMQAFDLLRGARTPHTRPTDKLIENLEEMGQKLTGEHLELELNHVADGLLVRFGKAAGFAPGSTRVNDVLAKSLGELGSTVEHYPHTIVIEGFTDSAFVPTPTHPSPRALALARARSAADVLLSHSGLAPEQVQVAGRVARSGGLDDALSRRSDRRVEVRILAMDRARARELAEDRR